MHPSKVLLHVLGWKHVNVLDSHRLEDVFLEVVVEAHPGCAFDELASPMLRVSLTLVNSILELTSRCLPRTPTFRLVG